MITTLKNTCKFIGTGLLLIAIAPLLPAIGLMHLIAKIQQQQQPAKVSNTAVANQNFGCCATSQLCVSH